MNLLQTFLKSLFFSLKKKKRDFTNFPETSLQTTANFTEISFFKKKKKKKEILQTSQKPLYKKGFKKVQVSTGTALAFILLETAKKKRDFTNFP